MSSIENERLNKSNMAGRIDEAYKKKYSDSPYLRPMISGRARSATVKILPREVE